jgi:hypothetical protein
MGVGIVLKKLSFFPQGNQIMTCSAIALLLTLVLTGRMPELLAADDGMTLAARQVALLALPCPECLRPASPFQSPVCRHGDESAADASSPYDMYYSDGLEPGYCAGNFQSENGGQSNGNDKNGMTEDSGREGSAIDARLARSLHGGASWLAAAGKTVMDYASCWWEQGRFVRENNPGGDEAELKSVDASDDGMKTAENASSAETERTVVGEPPRQPLVECLYVAAGPKFGDAARFAAPGRISVQHSLGFAPQSAVFAEFYWVGGEVCPNLTTDADATVPWRVILDDGGPGAKGDSPIFAEGKVGTVSEQPASALSVAMWLVDWVKASLADGDAAFRSISQRIARLDWTLLLNGQSEDRAVRNTAPASNPIAR